MDSVPEGSAIARPNDASATPHARAHSIGARTGAGLGAIGGLGAIAGFALPWFVFISAVQVGCHGAALQLELYNLYGAGLAFSASGGGPAALALAALLCAVAIVITCILSLHRPTIRRARLLLALAVVGVGALCVVAALASRGQITVKSLPYAGYLGFATGFWITVGGLLLAWVGGAVQHAAMRLRRGATIFADVSLAALGIVGLLASGAVVTTERLAPFPTMTCVRLASASPAAQTAYFTSADGLYALDAATGSLQWRCRNPLGGVVTAGPPALAASGPIVASRDGAVYALRATDATILWRADIGRAEVWRADIGNTVPVSQTQPIAPIVENGAVYGIDIANRVYALRATDGSRLWAPGATSPTAWLGSPLLFAGGALLYQSLEDGRPHLTALDSQSGRLLWQATDAMLTAYPYNEAQSGPLRLGDSGVVYDEEIDSSSHTLYLVAHSVADGATRWRYRLTEEGDPLTPSAFTVADGAVYLETRTPVSQGIDGQTMPRVVALRAGDGVVIWGTAAPDGSSVQRSLNTQTTTTFVFADGRVYLAVSWGQPNPGDTVYSFDAQRGTILWRYDLSDHSGLGSFGQTSLHALDGSIYLLDPFNDVVRLDAQGGSSQWQRDAVGALQNGQSIPTAALTLGPPATSGSAPGLLYVVTTQVYALNVTSGAIRWRYTPDTPTTPYRQQYGAQLPSISSPIFAP